MGLGSKARLRFAFHLINPASGSKISLCKPKEKKNPWIGIDISHYDEDYINLLVERKEVCIWCLRKYRRLVGL